MELRQIEYFVQLYQDKNITKASKNLYISQQGLSKSINKLEEELGFLLFERSSAGVLPTEKAEQLYTNFENILTSYQELLFAIDHIQEKRVLKILAPHGFALSCNNEDFSEYHKLYPDTETRYAEEYNHLIPNQLITRQADVSFMLAPIPKELTSHMIIYKEPFYAVMDHNHPLAKKKVITLRDLSNQTFLLLDLYQEQNKNLLRQADMENVCYHIYDNAKMNTFLSRIQSSPLIGFSSKRIYRHYNFSDVVFIPISFDEYPDLIIETHIVTLKNVTLDNAMRHYIDYELHRQEKRISSDNLLYR